MKFKKSYKTPVTKLDYLGGRFLAAFAVNALLVLSLSGCAAFLLPSGFSAGWISTVQSRGLCQCLLPDCITKLPV